MVKDDKKSLSTENWDINGPECFEERISKNKIPKTIILTTGGTIEKTYDEFDGSLSNKQPVIKELISGIRLPHSQIEYEMVMAKDSLYMDDGDRKIICQAINEMKNKANGIIIVHGTDTMAETAEYCYNNLKNIKIPIIFTGAMKPLGFRDSDAYQNITESLMASRLAFPGIYISFHGKLFNVPGVAKNRKLGTFEKC